jgi:uncharacterized membrane protein
MPAVSLKTGTSPFVLILVVLLTPLTMYFLVVHAFPRLNYSEAAYGDYYWDRAPWLLIHAVCGIFATLSGPFQFIPAIRNNYWRLHRNLGKMYLISVGAAGLSAIYLAVTSAMTPWYSYGLIVGGTIWLFTGTMAYLHIRNKRTKLHKQMMIRNYVVTFFFIIFFGMYDLLVATGTDPYNETMLSILPWACLIIPLGITEMALANQKTQRML